MSFQLVRATDDEIVVWHTEHGHIYLYEIPPKARDLTMRWFKNIPDATQDAESLKSEAQIYATEQSRIRRLIG
ncbi:hypothetical protein [Lichenihabitans psoromatis]|uniref:hypothetical protein n=1 Tax=Lichenihabitans psoromatis TaxID=2528642 RepID=UPI0010363F89|nr:hypothetical protein [Lichenihabitans psoromatis]